VTAFASCNAAGRKQRGNGAGEDERSARGARAEIFHGVGGLISQDRELLEEATVRVKMRVTPKTWQAFERTAIQGQSGAEAAAALDMKVATVFVARSKVQKMLQDEIQKLEGSSS
jgi:RNA polymerase sigma-70 factor (ECF subfamily)